MIHRSLIILLVIAAGMPAAGNRQAMSQEIISAKAGIQDKYKLGLWTPMAWFATFRRPSHVSFWLEKRQRSSFMPDSGMNHPR
jgi:hypothetical protein